MTNQTLFGHLALQFTKSPENIATEALSYVLGRSTAANAAFARHLRQTEAMLPDRLTFQTQARKDDDAIPDLVGVNAQNQTVTIGEAKFWAGLTDNQPVGYLRRLSQSKGTLLFFVAPAKRFPTLWAELLRRCQAARLDAQPLEGIGQEYYRAAIGRTQYLALCSWRSVLHALHDAAEADSDTQTAADIQQLEGLCERMDTTAFLPLQAAELTSQVGARIVQYCELVDAVTDELVARKVASVAGLRATARRGEYGRYMLIGQQGIFLHLSARRWRERRETPLWMRIRSVNDAGHWDFPSSEKAKLRAWFGKDPPRVIEHGDSLWIPLYLPVGREKDAVIKAIIDQIDEVTKLLE